MKVEGTEKTAMFTMRENMESNQNIDIKDYFMNELSDEIEGSNKYADLARQAEEQGDATLAYGLYEMSKDEFTHAKFIHDKLITWGCEIPQEDVTKYHQLKSRISYIFR